MEGGVRVVATQTSCCGVSCGLNWIVVCCALTVWETATVDCVAPLPLQASVLYFKQSRCRPHNRYRGRVAVLSVCTVEQCGLAVAHEEILSSSFVLGEVGKIAVWAVQKAWQPVPIMTAFAGQKLRNTGLCTHGSKTRIRSSLARKLD